MFSHKIRKAEMNEYERDREIDTSKSFTDCVTHVAV